MMSRLRHLPLRSCPTRSSENLPLDHISPVGFCVVLHVIRDFLDLDLVALIIKIIISLHLEQVDNSFEGIFLPDRELQRYRVFRKSRMT